MNQVKNAVKELRKQSKPVHEIKIQIFKDNSIEVTGFPNNYRNAMALMSAGMARVGNYFMAMAMEGKLDDKLNIKKSRIMESENPLLGPDGKRLQ